ncbi:Aste57867_8649 [Aphanomyces stellatus]|uniref:Aste57867_8649 protein n=1 Tax=Aphanomyces stellatus TaxID=120398 RepID=A0A485KKW8_9STRA|nr:hypothetical protein As57867_008615 [Aphanomyces stellatus]VFT85535.1 Aste57867_8649 [Aphanomyces stellatus]
MPSKLVLYRREKKQQKAALKLAIVELERLQDTLTQAANAKKRGMLPWEVVAKALMDVRKEWITKQMYHNTDRMFIEYGFPSMASTECLLSLQCLVPTYAPLTPMVLEQVDSPTRQHAFFTPRGEFINVVVREFRTADRCVLVMQQIQQDELCVQ